MVLNYGITFQVLQQFIETHNKAQDSTKTMVRQAMNGTAKEILRIYGVTLIKAQKIAPLRPDRLPSLRTNNKQLATLTGASGRTIQRHIQRLLDAKVLLQKVWHGSNASYELWINPKILWISGYGHVDNYNKRHSDEKKCTPENQSINSDTATNCPHSYTYKKTKKNNNILIAVDKLQQKWQEPSEIDHVATKKKTENTTKRNSLPLMAYSENADKTKKKTGNTQEKEAFASNQTKKAKKQHAGKPEGAGRNFTSHDKGTQGEEAWRGNAREKKLLPPDGTTNQKSLPLQRSKTATRHALLISYTERLWSKVESALYDPKVLTKRQIAIGKTLLLKWYEPICEQKLETVHQVYVRRVLMVEKYLKKDPENRFVQLPYRYFNPENPHGFAGTMPWYKAEKAYKKQRELQRILRGQIRKFKRNEAAHTAEARPRLEVFRECEQRIAKLEIPALLQEFYKAILPPKSE